MNDPRNQINPKHGVPCPLYLKCSVTGKETVWSNPKIIAAKIAAAGSLEAFLKNYKSRGAGKPAKEPKSFNGKPIISAAGSTNFNAAPTDPKQLVMVTRIAPTKFKHPELGECEGTCTTVSTEKLSDVEQQHNPDSKKSLALHKAAHNL